MDNYRITDEIGIATHWLAKQTSYYDSDAREYCLKVVKIGKFYPLIYDEKEDEYWIQDEEGNFSMIWLCHNGDFVIMQE